MLVGWPVSCHAGNSFWECSASCSVQSEKAKSIARCRNCGGLGKFDLFVWAGGPDTLSYRPSQVNPFPAWPSFLSQDLELDVDLKLQSWWKFYYPWSTKEIAGVSGGRYFFVSWLGQVKMFGPTDTWAYRIVVFALMFGISYAVFFLL